MDFLYHGDKFGGYRTSHAGSRRTTRLEGVETDAAAGPANLAPAS